MYPLDDEVVQILRRAKEEAIKMGNSYIGTEHVLLAMMAQPNGLLPQLVEDSVTYQQMKRDLGVLFGTASPVRDSLDYTDTMWDVLKQAEVYRKEAQMERIAQKHILTALLHQPHSVAKEMLHRYGVCLEERLQCDNHIKELDEMAELTNLNVKMMQAPAVVYGREKELEQIVEILLRKEKANPLLIGDAGVGKSAVVEELAYRLAQGRVPHLEGNIVYEMNINGIVAGTKYRGEFEEKIQKMLEAVRKYPQAIVFVDEIHQMMGAGKAEGSLDVAGVIKPYLARKELRCIGATTYQEYERHILRDQAMQRRFQPVHMKEFTPEQMRPLAMLKQKEYTSFHGLEMDADSVSYLLAMSDYYLPSRRFPDKLIDVMDLSFAKAKRQGKAAVDRDVINAVLAQCAQQHWIDEADCQKETEHLRTIWDGSTVKKLQPHLQAMCEHTPKDGVKDCLHIVGSDEDAHAFARWLSEWYQDRCLGIVLDGRTYGMRSAWWDLFVSPWERPHGWLGQLMRYPFSVVHVTHADCLHPDLKEVLHQAMQSGQLIDSLQQKIDIRQSIWVYSQAPVSHHSLGYAVGSDVEDENSLYLRRKDGDQTVEHGVCWQTM